MNRGLCWDRESCGGSGGWARLGILDGGIARSRGSSWAQVMYCVHLDSQRELEERSYLSDSSRLPALRGTPGHQVGDTVLSHQLGGWLLSHLCTSSLLGQPDRCK